MFAAKGLAPNASNSWLAAGRAGTVEVVVVLLDLKGSVEPCFVERRLEKGSKPLAVDGLVGA